MLSRELEAVEEVEGTVAVEVGCAEEEGRACVFEEEDDDDARVLAIETGYFDSMVEIGRGEARARRACMEGSIVRACTCMG